MGLLGDAPKLGRIIFLISPPFGQNSQPVSVPRLSRQRRRRRPGGPAPSLLPDPRLDVHSRRRRRHAGRGRRGAPAGPRTRGRSTPSTSGWASAATAAWNPGTPETPRRLRAATAAATTVSGVRRTRARSHHGRVRGWTEGVTLPGRQSLGQPRSSGHSSSPGLHQREAPKGYLRRPESHQKAPRAVRRRHQRGRKEDLRA